MKKIPESLRALTDYNQWVLWIFKDGKKLPVNPTTLKLASSTNPNDWSDSTTAINTAALLGDSYGIGFVFTESDPFYFIDIDHCAVDGAWSPLANTILSMTSGAATEISQSGEGLHIIGKGIIPDHSCRNTKLGLEFYHTERFVALTGTGAIGDANTDHTTSLTLIRDQYFPVGTTVDKSLIDWTSQPVPEWSGFIRDDKLIEKAITSTKSANATFGDGASFNDLWTRNESVLTNAYGADESDPGNFDESKADAALAQHLAFWTGNNCDRILALMNQSALKRDKWKRADYMTNTILRAVGLQTTWHQRKSVEPPRVPVDAIQPSLINMTPIMTEGYQFLGITQQVEYFKGCCYVQDVHRVITPNGAMLKPEQFNAVYGGYVFQLEADASGKTTRRAWEAFTESQGVRYPKAETTCFRPQLGAGVIIREQGVAMVNTYVPLNIPMVQGDITPFLKHLELTLPNQLDRDILIAYMAAVIQYKGVKFQWAPLIQGVEGNGKTLFTRVVTYAIGKRYTHMPRASEISEKFNSWLFEKLFIGVEDVYVPEHKSEVIEILKPMITADEYEKRDMGVAGKMYELCCNFIFNSNHKDGVRKTRNDRRFAIFYCAQQSDTDIKRDGMDGNYFPELYKWLRNGGYSHVAQYLGVYAIPDKLNPAGDCHRAPYTSSTEEAINSGLGSIEQEVLEAIDEGRIGFANGWVSSMALDRLLDQLRATRLLPRRKRKVLLEALGYEHHRGLNEGRTTSIVSIDGGKPRLYIKIDHISANLQGCNAIVKAYSDAQLSPIKTAQQTFGESNYE